jgi:peptidoglycan/xylan/chitin deacetylase (PgdA/CDA1 family)
MRIALRRPAAALALSGPVAPVTRRALERRTKIVFAHHVGPPAQHHVAFGPALTQMQLDDHLTTLGRHFEFASLSDVLEHNTDGSGSSQMLAVTFDDGFDLLQSGALEVLNAHGVKATTFVLTAMLDNRGLMWRNKLSAIQTLRSEETYVSANNRLMESIGSPGIHDASEFLSAAMRWDMGRKEELVDALWAACDMPPLSDYLDEHRPYFSTEALARWVADGHAVGLHTHTHPDCARLDDDGVRAEIIEPARRLSAELKVASLAFSYPFGRRCSAAHERMLAETGILQCALGIRGFSQRGTSPFRLERASIEGDMRFSVYGKALLGFPRSRLA